MRQNFVEFPWIYSVLEQQFIEKSDDEEKFKIFKNIWKRN